MIVAVIIVAAWMVWLIFAALEEPERFRDVDELARRDRR